MRLLQALYQISTSAARVDDDITDWFRILTGVRQGCIWSPQLFNILLELVISLAIQDLSIFINLQVMTQQPPVCWRYRPDGWLCWWPSNTGYNYIHTVSRRFSLTINRGENRGPNDLQRKWAYVHLHWWEKTETSRDLHLNQLAPMISKKD